MELSEILAKEEMLSARFEEVDPIEFYNYVFPIRQEPGVQESDFSKPNPIYLYYDEEAKKIKRRVMLSNFDEEYSEYVEENNSTICGGLTYRGRTNRLDKAQNMNAMIFDLDGVGPKQLDILLQRMLNCDYTIFGSIPKPTFIVNSGSGIHIYYVFDEPIPLFPNIKLQLKELKHDLTKRKIWDYKGTTTKKDPEYQSINQGFRMVGSANDKHNGYIIKAYKIGDRVSLDYMNLYALSDCKVDVMKRFKTSKCSKEQAKLLYPEWYQQVVVEGNQAKGKWNIGYRKKLDIKDDALYQWWLKQVEKAQPGHRYHYMLCTVIYACKNGVPKAKVRKDLENIYETLKKLKHENELTKDDMNDALEIYSKEYFTYTIKDIEKISAIEIERNRRNYRKQDVHLKRARAVRDAMNDNWRDGNGRKPQIEVIKEWREVNPEGTKKQCKDETGLTYPTIRKWWNYDERLVKQDKTNKNLVEEEMVEVEDMVDGITYYAPKKYIQNEMVKSWHNVLPEFFVVNGDYDMMAKMMEYASKGVKSVEILSKEEYEYLKNKGKD